MHISRNFTGYLFGLEKSEKGDKTIVLNEEERQSSLLRIKSFNLAKRVMWACVLDSPTIPKENQKV